MTQRRSTTGLGVLLSALAFSAVAAGEEVYVGAVSMGGQATSPALRLTIREYTPDERVVALAELLHKDGHVAAIAEMAKGQSGTVQLGDGPTFKASVIRQEKTATGRLLRVVTARTMSAAAAGPPPTLPADAVGYLELTLPAAGEGTGRLLPAVKIVFDAEGFLSPENLGPEWRVSKVKPDK
jgi:hypothetical protein